MVLPATAAKRQNMSWFMTPTEADEYLRLWEKRRKMILELLETPGDHVKWALLRDWVEEFYPESESRSEFLCAMDMASEEDLPLRVLSDGSNVFSIGFKVFDITTSPNGDRIVAYRVEKRHTLLRGVARQELPEVLRELANDADNFWYDKPRNAWISEPSA